MSCHHVSVLIDRNAHGTLLVIESLNTAKITVFAAHCDTAVNLFCSLISKVRDDSNEHTYTHTYIQPFKCVLT